MSLNSNPINDYDYDHDYNYDHNQNKNSQLNIPKLRQSTSNAAPATPRMLRNTSNNNPNHYSSNNNNNNNNNNHNTIPNSLSDEYTINPDYLPPQRTPSKRLPNSHNRDSSINNNNNNGLLPGVDFNPNTPQKSSRRSSFNNNNNNNPNAHNRINSFNIPPQSNQQHSQQHHPQQPPPQHAQPPQQQQFHRKAIGDWEFTKTIGAGSMGKVKLANHRITNEICAIKVVTRAAKVWQRQHINDPPTNDPHLLSQRKKEYEKEIARDKRTIREAALGKILYHPYICRLYEIYSMSNHYYMLFEYVSGGQMLDYIVAHGSLKESQARKFCRGIGSALEYCHSNNIVHRDLKIENIMINNSGEIKIIDFGLSNLYTHDHLLKTYCGSLYFAAPELLSAHPYRGPEVDIWSFGVVLFVLVCGRVPFDDKSVNNLHEKIKKGNVEYPDHLSADCIDLMKKMLVVDTTKRAPIHEILSHRWMNKGYSNIVSSFIPKRVPLNFPLDSNIINEIVNLNLGISNEQVFNDLNDIINSDYYIQCSENWRLKNSGLKYDPTLLDPTKGYHPLISIYYLVFEMIQRKKNKLENLNQSDISSLLSSNNNVNQFKTPQIQQEPIFNAASNSHNMAHEPQNRIVTQPIPHEYQHNNKNNIPQNDNYNTVDTNNKSQRLKLDVNVPNPSYTLPYPQPAHTSPHTDISPHSFNKNDSLKLSQQQTPPPQQLNKSSNVEEGGVNSLLRKLSSKKPTDRMVHNYAGSTSPISNNAQINNTDNIKRIGSVKVTSKEKQQILPSSIQNTARKNMAQHQRAASAYTASAFVQDNQIQINNQQQQQQQSLHSQQQQQSQYNEPSSTSDSSSVRKFHPSARAKSVGHARKYSLNNLKSNTYKMDSNAPPLPEYSSSMMKTSTSNDYGAFFDEEMDNITFNDESNKPKVKLTDKQIIAQFEKAPPNSMPSIEYPKTLFLKGFFSVQTTSTKPLPIIRYDIITVLPQLGVQFVEVKGGFICVHYPSIVDTPRIQVSHSSSNHNSSNTNNNVLMSPIKTPTKVNSGKFNDNEDQYIDTIEGLKTPNISETSSQISKSKNSSGTDRSREDDLNNESYDKNSVKTSNTNNTNNTNNSALPSTPIKGHRRKFSLGNGILGSKKGEKLTLSTSMSGKYNNEINIPTTPAAANLRNLSIDDSSESIALDETNGASDMLVSSRLEQQNYNISSSMSNYDKEYSKGKEKERSSKTPLKFEIHIVKVPLVGLYGIQFKKVSGNTWLYKSLASEILNRLNL
ncbi:serine/threonine protein kinase [Pichia kluyveri]|uniref:non-specific serine/threonine protein kinase n=1 Tax=Pichia kluyveri TaxID=36015 RepID=A0AAV5RA20_PICKL|nr:serine/threonine protein kinase [Pichia kluyveri]